MASIYFFAYSENMLNYSKELKQSPKLCSNSDAAVLFVRRSAFAFFNSVAILNVAGVYSGFLRFYITLKGESRE